MSARGHITPLIPPESRLGLSLEEAAAYIGVGRTLFGQMVEDGRMPRPKIVNSRRLWSREDLHRAFARLPEEAQADDAGDPWADCRV